MNAHFVLFIVLKAISLIQLVSTVETKFEVPSDATILYVATTSLGGTNPVVSYGKHNRDIIGII
jgi:hypothetical protein